MPLCCIRLRPTAQACVGPVGFRDNHISWVNCYAEDAQGSGYSCKSPAVSILCPPEQAVMHLVSPLCIHPSPEETPEFAWSPIYIGTSVKKRLSTSTSAGWEHNEQLSWVSVAQGGGFGPHPLCTSAVHLSLWDASGDQGTGPGGSNL